MDTEKLEIVTTEEAMTGSEAVAKADILGTYGPIAAGVLAGGLIGFLVCKFGPKVIAKFKKPAEKPEE